MKQTKTDFFEQVYEVVRLIPVGKVSTYGAIARYLGSPQAARTVGYAMNKSFGYKKSVPAHRVVNRNGCLSGKHYFGGSNMMQELIEAENIIVKEDIIINFDTHFWDPNVELV